LIISSSVIFLLGDEKRENLTKKDTKITTSFL